MHRFKNKKYFIFILSLLILSSSPNILIFDYGNLRYYYITILLFLAITLFKFNKISINKNNILFALLLSSIFISGIYNWNIKNIVIAIYVSLIYYFILTLSFDDLKKLINIICGLLGVMSILGLIQVTLYLCCYRHEFLDIIRSIDGVKAGIQQFKNILPYLGGADSYIKFYSFIAPRFSGFVDQSSAVSAIMLLPAALSLFLNKKFVLSSCLILLFSLFSLSASVYICLITSLLIYLLIYKSKYLNLIFFAAPFLLFILSSAILLNNPSIVVYGDQPFGEMVIKDYYGFVDYLLGRSVSGFARISLISDGIQNFLNNPLFGIPNNLTPHFGQIFVSYGENYGIFAGVLIGIILFKLISLILEPKIFAEKYSKYGYALTYALLFQFIAYNDYAISRIWGLIFFFIIHQSMILAKKE